MAGFWESLLPGGLGAYGYSEVMGDISNQRDKVAGTVADLTEQAKAGTEFRPWGVTSNTGNISGGPEGVSATLSPEQQAMQQQLFGGASGMFASATGDTAAREQEMYDRIRATQTPEEERQRLQLQQGLFNSGRGGISTAAGGGGSPEQLAYETARQEAMNRASLGAIGMAQQQQLQDANIGNAMLSSSYMPEMQLWDRAGYGLNNAQMNQYGQLQGTNLMTQLGLGGLTADTNYSNIGANAFGNMITAALPVAGAVGQRLDNATGSIWDFLAGS